MPKGKNGNPAAAPRRYAMRLSLSVYTALVVAILSLATNVHAAPITYEISGVASGTIGASTFTDALIELTGTGDTANVTSLLGGEVFGNPFNSFTVTIGGVGTATITDPSEIWAVPTSGPFSVPAVVMGRIDSPPALDSITGLGVVASNALAGYEGNTGIGPITDAGGIGFPACSGPMEDPCVHTTLGLLSFTENLSTTPTGQATFVATVPEPATLFLVVSGAAALVGRWRLRTRRSYKK
jgi:PEP-CTERM motif-containing protein